MRYSGVSGFNGNSLVETAALQVCPGKVGSRTLPEAEKTFIPANNHWRGQPSSAIRQLRVALD